MFVFRPSYVLVALVVLTFAGGGQAHADDISLDHVALPTKTGGTVTIKHLEFDGTNLTKDDVVKLFSAHETRQELASIITKLTASKLLIPEIVVVAKDATSTLTFYDFQATGIGNGRVAHMSLAGFDGTDNLPDVGPLNMHSGQITIDGGDFSRLLPALRDGDIAQAGSAEIANFTWQGLTMTFLDKGTPATAAGGNLYQLAIASIDGHASYVGDLPDKASAELKNFTIEPPKASKFGQSLAAFGYDRIDLSFSMSGSYRADSKTYILDNYTIYAPDAGSLGLTAKFGGIDKSAFSGDRASRLAALARGNVSSATLHVVNNGLFEKALAYVAKMQDKTPGAVKQQWSDLASELLPALLIGNPGASEVTTAVTKFIAAPKAMTITAKAKGDPLAFSDFLTGAPALLLQRIDLDAVLH